MPFTLSHPAAVLPLRRCCPPLRFAGLAVGSIIPDFGYYVPLLAPHAQTHSLWGILLFGLPAGWLLLALLQVLKRPLCFVLPQPHRGALTPLAAPRTRLPGLRDGLWTSGSILLGAWTHIAWDSFTHVHRWGPQHLAWLNALLFRVDGQAVALYECLQWLSSVAGGAILLSAYRRWLRRHPATASAMGSAADERWRYLLLGALAIAALGCSLPYAWIDAAAFHGVTAGKAFVFQWCVRSITGFAVLLLPSAVLLYWLGGRQSAPESGA